MDVAADNPLSSNRALPEDSATEAVPKRERKLAASTRMLLSVLVSEMGPDASACKPPAPVERSRLESTFAVKTSAMSVMEFAL